MDSGNWRTATDLSELQREAYSRYRQNSSSLFPLSAGWLTAISYLQRTSHSLDKPHILALAAETGFLLFKEQVPLKFKKEISAVQCKRNTF
jgi:hypothetical protein